MQVSEFERRVLEVEEVVIRVRLNSNVEIEDYDYQRRAADGTSVTEWLDQRVIPKVDGAEVSIIDGNFTRPHGRTRMRTLRDSYER